MTDQDSNIGVVEGTPVRACATCGGDVFRTNTCYCKSCWRIRSNAYYAKDPEKRVQQQREYRIRKPDVVRKTNANAHLKKMGVDMQWYEAKAESQNHLCAICKLPELQDGRSRLCIDHDHSCCPQGKSCERCRRDLLCGKCNLMIGCALENVETLDDAIKYLKHWKGGRYAC